MRKESASAGVHLVGRVLAPVARAGGFPIVRAMGVAVGFTVADAAQGVEWATVGRVRGELDTEAVAC